MSEQGWRDFRAADGIDDWVVLHGGATAVFRVGSVGEAARLAEAIGAAPGVECTGVVMTIRDGTHRVPAALELGARRSRRQPDGSHGVARRRDPASREPSD